MILRRAALAVWDFIVGDDWRSAAGVVATLAATAAVAGLGLPAWWVCPVATLAVLYRSVRRAVRPSGWARRRRLERRPAVRGGA